LVVVVQIVITAAAAAAMVVIVVGVVVMVVVVMAMRGVSGLLMLEDGCGRGLGCQAAVVVAHAIIRKTRATGGGVCNKKK